jgi:SAM-dependent methyltransferase
MSQITLNPRHGWMGWWPLGGLKAILDPENARIKHFLIGQHQEMSGETLLLDAGAGSCPYKSVFTKVNYESTDMPDGFYKTPHTFECFLHDIPKGDNTYDVVVLTQVLEHVPSPHATMKEICRVLKPGGKLLLSVPMNAPLHGEPWHFFQFTHYGIAQLAEEAGFVVNDLEKIGGTFWQLGKRLPDAFRKLNKQYDPFRAKKRQQNIWFCTLLTLLLMPVWLFIYLPSAYVFRPLCYWLDIIDAEKSFTLGYTAVLIKAEICEADT